MNADVNDTRMKMLGEFAEMALVLARDLQQAALVAEEADEKVRLADAFHKQGRGLRQSLALHARLERDAETEVRAAEARKAERDRVRRQRRKAEISGQVEHLIWTEAEKPDSDLHAENTINSLELLLDAEAEREDFLDQDPEVLVARLCRVLIPSPHIPGRHGRACPGHPETPTAQDDPGGSAAIQSETPAHLGSRDKPGNNGVEGDAFNSSA